MQKRKIIISVIIIIISQYIASLGYNYLKTVLQRQQEMTNFSILNYSANTLKLITNLNNEGMSYSKIYNSILQNELQTDFELILLDENKLTLFKTHVFNDFNFNQLIINSRNHIFSQKVFQHFIYKNLDNSYLVSKKDFEINNQEMTLLIVSKMESGFYLFLHFGLPIFSLLFLLSVALIYNIFFGKQRLFSKEKRYKGFVCLEALEEYFKLPYIIVSAQGSIIALNQEMASFINIEMSELYYRKLTDYIPEMDDLPRLMQEEGFKEIELTVNNYDKWVKLKVLPYVNLVTEIDSYLIILDDITEIKKRIENSQSEQEKLKLLHEIAKAISVLSEPKIIIERVLNITRKMTNFTSATILIPDGKNLDIFYTNNPELLKRKDTVKLKVGEGLAGTVANTLKGMILNDADKSVLAKQVPGTELHQEHLIGVPMTSKNSLTGVMVLSRVYNERFTYSDLSFLDMVASSTSSILHNSILLKQLSTSEKKYRSLINNSTIGMFIIREGRTLFVNNTFIKILGLLPELHIGEPFISLVFDKDKNLFNQSLTKFLLDSYDDSVQIRLKNHDGKILVTEMSFRKINWEKQPAVMGNIIDITERVSLNKQLEQSQKLESIGSLTGGIAHDFKNILTAIIGAVEILDRKSQDPQTFKYSSIIKTSAERGASLAKRLLSYSRESSEENVVFDINEQMDEVISIAKYTMPQGIIVDQNLSKQLLLFEGDPIKIQQCILNLAVNARDAMGKEGVLSIKSDILNHTSEYYNDSRLHQDKQYALITVTDTGHGISEENIRKIFDPFFTTKEKGKGTGIGLATTFSIIQEYKGIIDVDSTINKGTTFSVILPLTDKKMEQKKKQLEDGVDSKFKILLVDDEDVILDIASEMFSELGHQVKTVNNALDAVDLLNSGSKFDAVFIDRRMPDMDGTELFFQLKEIDSSLKIIMASGNIEDKHIEDLKKKGLYDYLTKPYRFTDIRNTLKKIKPQEND